MEEKKIVVHLQKQDLASDRRLKKLKKRSLTIKFLLVLVSLWVGFSAGFLMNKQKAAILTKTGNHKVDVLKQILGSAWLYKDNLKNLDDELSTKAYKGMTSFEDDPYTNYLSKDELKSFTSSIDLKIVGIGVTYFQNAGLSTITQVFKDSPAEKAGLEVGDIILAVDGQNIADKNAEEIKTLVVGKEGSVVKLLIQRDGKEKEVNIIRGPINTTVYADKKGNSVYLKIYSFGSDTAQEVKRYLDDYRKEEKIIIDLRDNGGGYQNAVEDIAGLFLPPKTLMMRQTFVDGHEEKYYTKQQNYYSNFKKIVILVNRNTASASEVLTMALKEMHPNTLIVGEKTYGKGVVQTTYPLSDGSAVKVTTSKWLSPKMSWINKKGILPDKEILLDEALYYLYPKFIDGDIYQIDSVSPFVKGASLALRFNGYQVDRVDGYFSSSIKEALFKYQTVNGLSVNGTLDKNTYENLVASVLRRWNLNKDSDIQLKKAIEIINE